MTDKVVGSPTSASSFSAPAQAAAEAADAASMQLQTPKASGSRKRVFTFQKRWLHSLPIVERSLPETEMDGRVLKAVRTAGGATAAAAVAAAAAAGADKHKDVIVCMLCDDPSSKRELTKVWSRLNCRRGRIENHLMSKHPEFMRLLKHKREAEGDLAVQIFLQNLREGRCNARTEINNGLYNQLQNVGAGVRANATPTAGADHAELQKRALGDYMNVREDLESSRKRVKLATPPAGDKDAAAMAASAYSAGGMIMLRSNGAVPHVAGADGAAVGVDGLAPHMLYQDAAMSAQWQTVFYNKLVVVTGGDNRSAASVATQLWLLGASVLLTFTNMAALEDFNNKHIARYPSEGEDTTRGVMLPVLGSFRTQKDVAEWCSSIASKYQRVDFLINFAGADVVKARAEIQEQPEDSTEDAMKSEHIVSSAALVEALSESMSTSCFLDGGEDGWLAPSSGAIVNIAPAEDDAAIAPLVKSLAAKLQPRNVQVNCVLLPPREPADEAAVEITDDTAVLSHSILFLLSPSSRLLSGSVLRLQKDKAPSHTASSPADRRAEVPPSAGEAAAADVIASHSI
ncbi:SDR family oxidoreductase [Phytophthora cinnamomi]|uniref:SDR family oxidoreductase n=1 Tax=Phytophthora cinnamomi TaxID=4785 RepID=UPI003559BC92|nr:SDR family oxidoreductase [Phytophthora cinnamomi]